MPRNLQCDGIGDCFDGSDEENCPTLGKCSCIIRHTGKSLESALFADMLCVYKVLVFQLTSLESVSITQSDIIKVAGIAHCLQSPKIMWIDLALL